MNRVILIMIICQLTLTKVICQENRASEISSKYSDAVVYIESNRGFGTGFFINSGGWIVTNYHVISNYEYDYNYKYSVNKYGLKIFTKNNILLDIENIDIINEYPMIDLAFIKVRYSSSVVIPISKDKNNIGDEVYTIGHPLGRKWTQTKGIISNIDYFEGMPVIYQIDAAVNPGNSGGPLINYNGYMIGVNSFKFTQSENLNFSISSHVLADILDEKNIFYSSFSLISSTGSQTVQSTPTELTESEKEELREEIYQAEQRRINNERELQDLEFNKRQNELNADLPKRIAAKLSYCANYYYGKIDSPAKTFDFEINSNAVSLMIGYRFDVSSQDDIGSIFGIFGKYGKLSEKPVAVISQEQYGNIVLPSETGNYFWEIETGFIFGEFFRLSLGYGNQLYQVSELSKIDKRTYEYFLSTIGFSFNIAFFNFDITSSLINYDRIENISGRLNLGIGFYFEIFR